MRQRVGLARALVVHPQGAADGRAVLGARRADRRDAAHRPARPVVRGPHADLLDPAGHAQHRGGGADVATASWCSPPTPAASSAEIKVDLPQPRNRLDPAFRAAGRRHLRAHDGAPGRQAGARACFPAPASRMVLPRVSPNLLAGLMEAVAAEPYHGKADLPALAGPLQMEIDDLFPVAETLQLLRFAEVAEGDIRLTDAGRRFVDARARRPQAAVRPARAGLRAARRATSSGCSTSAARHRAPASRFRDELEDHMSEEFAEQTLRAVTRGPATARSSPTTRTPASSASTIRRRSRLASSDRGPPGPLMTHRTAPLQWRSELMSATKRGGYSALVARSYERTWRSAVR